MFLLIYSFILLARSCSPSLAAASHALHRLYGLTSPTTVRRPFPNYVFCSQASTRLYANSMVACMTCHIPGFSHISCSIANASLYFSTYLSTQIFSYPRNSKLLSDKILILYVAPRRSTRGQLNLDEYRDP